MKHPISPVNNPGGEHSTFTMLHICKSFSYRLILGMMATSSFLSMWLSNTATTAMMLPIANAILESLFGDLETLKEKCKSPSDPELDLINGTEQNHPVCFYMCAFKQNCMVFQY